jgi:hypothetical protein
VGMSVDEVAVSVDEVGVSVDKMGASVDKMGASDNEVGVLSRGGDVAQVVRSVGFWTMRLAVYFCCLPLSIRATLNWVLGERSAIQVMDVWDMFWRRTSSVAPPLGPTILRRW